MALTAAHLADLPLHPSCAAAARPVPATYARRRLVALVLLGLLLAAALVGAQRVGVAFGGDPASVPERRPAVSRRVYVVQPGDTLWSIARALHPGDDPRPLVRALKAANGGSSALRPGQVLTLPGGGLQAAPGP